MEPFAEIHGFLREVRSHLIGRTAVRASCRAGAVLVMGSMAVPIAVGMLGARHARETGRGLLLLVVLGSIGALLGAIVLALRRYQGDRAIAIAIVGNERGKSPSDRPRIDPGVASDLLSTIELEPFSSRPEFSPELVLALAESTAERLRTIRSETFDLPASRLRAGWLLAGAAVLGLTAVLLAPLQLAKGWRIILAAAAGSPAGLSVVDQPIVGDIAVRLVYPAHTKRPELLIESSPGDITAPAGTIANLDTVALLPVSAARIVFEGHDSRHDSRREALPLVVDGRRLRASFKIEKPETFRFVIEQPDQRSVEESQLRHIDIEQDRSPRVDLVAPADELEVSSQRSVELAWAVEDDYGITSVALVWKSPDGREERKELETRKTADASRLQGRLLWDLAEVSLVPGTRASYRIEARDNDGVAGPKLGFSKTFY
ncbi:MAG: DUF4175 family protein, partial [Pseudomonadota bacterium]